MYDKTKAEAAAYAVEIELLTRALANLKTIGSGNGPAVDPAARAMMRRLYVLLDLEEGK